MFSRKLGIALALIGVIVIGILFFILRTSEPETYTPEPIIPEETTENHEVIGTSVLGRPIEAYTYGTGDTHLLFVGGVHGGYEWNSVLLAYQFMDYLAATSTAIPENLTIAVIPSLNPDGVYKVVGKEGRFAGNEVPDAATLPRGAGRFNEHGVDLNRNFDCKWKSESMWQGDVVSAGTNAFSEPEALALKNFVAEYKPTAAIFWHSKANAVYASECEQGILSETLRVMNTYAGAAGYSAVDTFDSYEITGDAEGWLASLSIPAITVELGTRDTTEWSKNLAGITALFKLYSQPK